MSLSYHKIIFFFTSAPFMPFKINKNKNLSINLHEAVNNLQEDVHSLEKTISYYEKHLEYLDMEVHNLREKVRHKKTE